jgi:hypothetical protein
VWFLVRDKLLLCKLCYIVPLRAPFSCQPLRRTHRVGDEHRYRHRTDPARHRREVAGLLLDPIEIYVTTRRPSGARLIPTSITAAPSFTMAAVMRFGLPAATTRMSARRVNVARSLVFEVQTVTVAPF